MRFAYRATDRLIREVALRAWFLLSVGILLPYPRPSCGQEIRAPELPFYLEDSHAGAFYWAVRELELDQPCMLLLLDAHSDATGIFDSDVIREAIRKPQGDPEAWMPVEKRWREQGVIQCFDWIEPLMPLPFSQVVWVANDDGSMASRRKRATEVEQELNAHVEIAPRNVGEIARRFRVATFSEAERLVGESDLPVIVSLDLDYFAGEPEESLPMKFSECWSALLALPRLAAVTGAVSRPFLTSEREAQQLSELFLDGALAVVNSRVMFEPFAETGPDRSRLHREFKRANPDKDLPRYQIEQAPSSLRSLLLHNKDRIQVKIQPESWEALLDKWAYEHHLPVALAAGADFDDDGVYRVRTGSRFSIRTDSEPGGGKVSWEIARASANVYRLIDDLGAGFATDASAWVFAPFQETDVHDARIGWNTLAGWLDPVTGTGTVRMRARQHREGVGDVFSNEIVLRVRTQEGFRGALEEQFGLPYILGAGFLRRNGVSGNDLAVGGDCANFIVYGLRETGARLGWSDPSQLRGHLEVLVKVRRSSTEIPWEIPPFPLREGQLDSGLIIDRGTHMAAVYEDKEPRGRLDGGDVLAHHLEGNAETIPLAAFVEKHREFQISRWPGEINRRGKDKVTLRFGGDVMLGRSVGKKISNTSGFPLERAGGILRGADFSAVNLECVLADGGKDLAGKPYVFRAPPEAVWHLKDAGIDLVSLGNNHSTDCGLEGLHEMREWLGKAGIGSVGAGKWSEAYGPHYRQVKNLVVGVVAFTWHDAFCQTARPENGMGVASGLNERWRQVLDAVRKSDRRADFTVVIPHWGVEMRTEVSKRQITGARELVKTGADLVVGAGPHCRQDTVTLDGGLVCYSLGNLVFDGDVADERWNQNTVLEVVVDAKSGKIETWKEWREF